MNSPAPAAKRVKTEDALIGGLAKPRKDEPFMRMSLLLMEPTAHNLRLAKQVGVTDIVLSYPGSSIEAIKAANTSIAQQGLRFSVIERLVPHDQIMHGLPGRDDQIENFKTLMRSMAAIPNGPRILCYNWMPADDWSRTSIDTADRGGALVTAYDAKIGESALAKERGRAEVKADRVTSAAALWKNLEYFLKAVVPVAEECGIDLALHPDDPPLPMLRGKPQIMYNLEAMEKATQLVPSERNGLCFCQGTFASAGVETAKMTSWITKLAGSIKYVHFRDVVGEVPHFVETFQDSGRTDMVACMKAYRAAGLSGPIRPDHVPTLDGEANKHPGYEMLGRLWAVGYMKGLMEAVTHDDGKGKVQKANQ